jgi:hypothetical protein
MAQQHIFLVSGALKCLLEHCVVYRYSDISWLAHLPNLYICDILLSSYLKSSVTPIRLTYTVSGREF